LVDREIHRLRLEDVCIRTEFALNMEVFLAAADVLCFPALTNHFARPVIEAAAMGKPVVASRFPILEELVEDRGSGTLVPPGEVRPLADALILTLTDAAYAARLGKRARDLAAERYDANKNVARIMSVYDEVLAR
jgi:glycosyltransferase involved in cell wall biosynthesis